MSTLWTPAEIATQQWFKSEGIVSSGGNVTAWNDAASEATNNATVFGGTPLLSQANGIDVVSFNGSASFSHDLELVDSAVFIVGSFDNPQNSPFAGVYSNGIENTSGLMVLSSVNGGNWGTFGDAGYTSTIDVRGRVAAIGSVRSGSGSAGTFYTDGEASGTYPSSISQGGHIGGLTASVPSQGFRGEVYEIVTIDAALATQDIIDRVFGYLLWKFGQQANLPAGHPYENAAPTVEPLWTPAELTTSLWLDAADAGSITDSSGSVTEWGDKSGNGNNATVQDGSPTTGTRTIGGLNALDFVPGQNLQVLDTPSLQFGTGDFTIASVYLSDNVNRGPTSQNTILSKDFTNWEEYIYQGGNSSYIGGQGFGLSGTASNGVAYIKATQRSGSDSVLRVDGTERDTLSGAPVDVSGVGTNIAIGKRVGGSASTFGMDGLIGEIVVVPTGALEDMELLEGYLAWKWGLQANLPAGHPYENAPPTIDTPDGPTINTQPQSQTVEEGQTATFSVSATSSGGSLSYQWYRGGVAVSGATAASYGVVAALADDGDSVYVEVTDDNGTVQSNTVTLTVTAIPQLPVITEQPTPQTAAVGDTATFSVTATSSSPLSYQWYRDGSPVLGETNSTFSITPETEDEGGEVYVLVNNVNGTVQSNTVTFTVASADGLTYTLEFDESRFPLRKRGVVVLNQPLAEGDYIQVERNTPIIKTYEAVRKQPFDSNAFEEQMDRLCLIEQEIEGHACDCRGIVDDNDPDSNPIPVPDGGLAPCLPYSCSALKDYLQTQTSVGFTYLPDDEGQDAFLAPSDSTQIIPWRGPGQLGTGDEGDELLNPPSAPVGTYEPFTLLTDNCGNVPQRYALRSLDSSLAGNQMDVPNGGAVEQAISASTTHTVNMICLNDWNLAFGNINLYFHSRIGRYFTSNPANGGIVDITARAEVRISENSNAQGQRTTEITIQRQGGPSGAVPLTVTSPQSAWPENTTSNAVSVVTSVNPQAVGFTMSITVKVDGQQVNSAFFDDTVIDDPAYLDFLGFDAVDGVKTQTTFLSKAGTYTNWLNINTGGDNSSAYHLAFARNQADYQPPEWCPGPSPECVPYSCSALKDYLTDAAKAGQFVYAPDDEGADAFYDDLGVPFSARLVAWRGPSQLGTVNDSDVINPFGTGIVAGVRQATTLTDNCEGEGAIRHTLFTQFNAGSGGSFSPEVGLDVANAIDASRQHTISVVATNTWQRAFGVTNFYSHTRTGQFLFDNLAQSGISLVCNIDITEGSNAQGQRQAQIVFSRQGGPSGGVDEVHLSEQSLWPANTTVNAVSVVNTVSEFADGFEMRAQVFVDGTQIISATTSQARFDFDNTNLLAYLGFDAVTAQKTFTGLLSDSRVDLNWLTFDPTGDSSGEYALAFARNQADYQPAFYCP